MNLLGLMLKEGVEWPVGAEFAAQDGNMILHWYAEYPAIYNGRRAWGADGMCSDKGVTMREFASYWDKIVVARGEYQAAGGKMLINGGDADVINAHQSVDATLTERGNRYGKFKDHAELSQKLEDVMRDSAGWARLEPDMREALEMIQHKIARILNGDPTYTDSWHDIAGYAKLVDDRLNGVEQ